jgi:hypothetical protein
MPNGFTIISSIAKALENALLALEDLAFRTAPAVRDFFPWGPRRDAVLWITLCGIVNPVAFKTDPAGVGYIW